MLHRFCDSERLMYIKEDIGKVRLEAALVQPEENYKYEANEVSLPEHLWSEAYASKSLTIAEYSYSNKP